MNKHPTPVYAGPLPTPRLEPDRAERYVQARRPARAFDGLIATLMRPLHTDRRGSRS
jgi:hypothetical protein